MKTRISIILGLSLFSCSKYKSMRNDLGSNYYLSINYIEYLNDEKYPSKIVIPPNVDSLAFDEKYIIASTIDDKGNPWYWIIDKNKDIGNIEKVTADDRFRDYFKFKNIDGPLNYSFFLKQTELIEDFNLELESLNRKIINE